MAQVRLVLFAAFILALGGCDEDFPPRTMPQEFLDAHLSAENATFSIGTTSPGSGGTLTLFATNLHDEVLQDSANIQATIDVWLESNSDIRESISLGPLNLVDFTVLRGRFVVLGPDSSVILRKQMTHRTTDGSGFWQHVPLTRGITQDGVEFQQSGPVRFHAVGRIQVFKARQELRTDEYLFTVAYRIFNP